MLVPGAMSAMFAASVMNVPALAAHAAGRRDPDDDRDLRLEQRADDVVASRSRLPPGVLSLIDDRRRTVALGAGDPVGEVAGHDVVDDAGRRQDDDLAARGAGRSTGQQPEDPQQQREREQEPADTTGHGDLRPAYRTAVRLEILERRAAPGLEPVARRPRPRPVRRRPPRACRSRGSRPAGRPRRPRRPHRGGPPPPSVVSSLSRRDEPEVRHEVGGQLLGPLAPKAAGQVAVARVEVAADADRVAVVEPRVAAGARAPHQEVAPAVAQHEVRDHLLERRVDLHRGARAERPSRSTRSAKPSRPSVRRPYQAGTVRQGAARDHEHLLIHRVRPPVAPARSRRRASMAASSGPPGRSSSTSQASMTARRSRSRTAMAGAFVAAIPAPIGGVAAGEAGHVAPAGRGQVVAPRPVRGDRSIRRPRHGLDERRGHDERQVADRGDHGVVGLGGPSRSAGRRRPRRATRRGPHRPSVASRPGRRPTAVARRGPRSPHRSRTHRGPPSGGRRRSAGGAPRLGRRAAPWCSRRR